MRHELNNFHQFLPIVRPEVNRDSVPTNDFVHRFVAPRISTRKGKDRWSVTDEVAHRMFSPCDIGQ